MGEADANKEVEGKGDGKAIKGIDLLGRELPCQSFCEIEWSTQSYKTTDKNALFLAELSAGYIGLLAEILTRSSPGKVTNGRIWVQIG